MVVRKKSAKHHSASAVKPDAPLEPDLLQQRLADLRTMLEGVTGGDFTNTVPLPAKDDVFYDVFAGIQAMRQTIRQQAEELKTLNQALSVKAADHNRALEEAQALTHLGSWEWDIATDTINWSDELYRIYGMRPQERSIGFEEFVELIHPDDRAQVQETIQTAFQSGEPFEFEHRIVLPTGDQRILKGMGKTVNDSEGKPMRMLGTSQDITQAKQLDRAKDEFISLVSHQLRTPLAIIRIHGNMLEDGIAGPLDPQQEVHIRTMTSSSIRLIELVDDILRISRISIDRIRINAEPTDPNQLIQACIDETLPMARKKGAGVAFQPDGSLGMVPIDTTIFGEILRNLVSNAVRYSNEQDGAIKISFAREATGYLLKVEDNGIGIPQADQEFIFERFYRANNATLADSEGSGLGLYIVKLFTEAAGGKIWLESTLGQGTTFYVSFPFHGMQARQPLPARR